MKKRLLAGAGLLAAALAAALYFFLFPGGSSQQLRLWYVEGDCPAAPLEELVLQYNRQRPRGELKLSLQGFSSEDELAAAFEQSRPELLLCSCDRAASLGSRGQLAELPYSDWGLLPEIEEALPFAGRSFFPLGSAVPVLACNMAMLDEGGSFPPGSLEDFLSMAAAWKEDNGSAFFSAAEAAPLLAGWSASLGSRLKGQLDRDSVDEGFCRVYNLLAQAAYDGCFAPPAGEAGRLLKQGLLPCVFLSSTEAASLGDGWGFSALPLPKEGERFYVPDIMGLAVFDTGSGSLSSAAAFISWLGDNYSCLETLSLGLVPVSENAACSAELPLSRLLMELYQGWKPAVYPPMSSYMERRVEFEAEISRALDLLY